MDENEGQSGGSQIWNSNEWRNWLHSQNFHGVVETSVSHQSSNVAKDIERTWNAALLTACIATTLAILILEWAFADGIRWRDLLGSVVIANVIAVAIWFIGYFRLGLSQRSVTDQNYRALAVKAADAAMDCCARLLREREERLARLNSDTNKLIRDTIGQELSNGFRNLSIEELKTALLAKFVGGKFVALSDGDLAVYFLKSKCSCCSVSMRSSGVERFAIEPVRAQAAGLEREEAIHSAGVELRFSGNRPAFESFFKREATETDVMLIQMGAPQIYCVSCRDRGIAAGLLVESPRSLPPPPDPGHVAIIDEEDPNRRF